MKQKDRIPSSRTFDNMGLYLCRKKLCWTVRGFGYKYIPQFVLRKIICIWNKISCLIFGHFWFPDTDKKHGATWSKNNKKLISYKYDVCCDCVKRVKHSKRKYM
jgi:hypothetical protein